MALDKELMEILACPACKQPVCEADESIFCTNAECRRKYAITDGFPVMLIEEAKVLEQAEFNAAMQKKPASDS